MVVVLWQLCTVLWLSVAAKQPHILYIIADDMGWSDIGFTQGKVHSQTPSPMRTVPLRLTQTGSAFFGLLKSCNI